MTESVTEWNEAIDFPERTIRPHHIEVLSKVIFRLARSSGASLEEICYQSAVEDERAAHTAFPEDPWETYREKHGHDANDTSVPASYIEDIEADDRDGFIARMAKTYHELLTLPDTTRVTITPSIDDMCKQAAFGNGHGGLHCHTILPQDEDLATRFLRLNIREYLKFPQVQADKKKNPERYKIENDRAPIACPLRVIGPQKDSLRTNMSLGLLRDVITYSETLFMRPFLLSYRDLLASKGIPHQSQNGKT